jgi:predicted outer membrane protein
MRRTIVSRCSAIAAVVLSISIAGWALAQRTNPNDQRQPQPGENAAQSGQLGQALLDRMAAESMMQMAKGQIELANFALKHTQNDDVRKFAQSIIQDATNMDNQFQKFVGQETSGQQPPNPVGTQNQTPPAGTQNATAPGRQTTTAPPAQGAPGATAAAGESNWKSMSIDTIRKDISDQVVAAIEKELAQYQGSDFDRAFAGQQFWGHVVFVASAKAGAKHVSGELRQIVDEGARTAERHLEDCRKLIRDLSANVARSSETTPRR